MNTVDLGKVRGNMIYTGGAVKGSSATGIIFRDTGIEKAYEGDIYINLDASGTDNGNVYECVESGESEYAKWAFKGNIRGPKMSAVNHLKSTSTEDALAAFQGKRILDMMIDAGIFSKHVIVECDQVVYGVKMTIDNVDSAFTFTVDGQKYTYNYAASGTVEKTTLSVVLGENIGMSKSGGVVSAIESTVAYIYDFRLTDSSAMDMYTKNVDLWESLNEVIRNHEVTGSVIDGEETVAMGPIHKFINGVKKMFYPITHAKAVWYDKANKKTVYDVIDEQNKKMHTSAPNVNLNELTKMGFYSVTNNNTAVDLNYPIGTNGIVVVLQYGAEPGNRGRQYFFREGTLNSNDHQWYTRRFIKENDVMSFGAWQRIISGKEFDTHVNAFNTFTNRLQCGTGTTGASGNDGFHEVTVTFQKAFSSVPKVVVTPFMAMDASLCGITIYNISKTGFKCRTQNASVSFTWIAFDNQ